MCDIRFITKVKHRISLSGVQENKKGNRVKTCTLCNPFTFNFSYFSLWFWDRILVLVVTIPKHTYHIIMMRHQDNTAIYHIT